jgi:hypothetical protein
VSFIFDVLRALGRLAIAVVLFAVGLFCVIWAASIIGHDVGQHVSPLQDKAQLALLLGIGALTLLELVQMLHPWQSLRISPRAQLEHLLFKRFSWYQRARFSRAAWNAQIRSGADDYLRLKTVSPPAARQN